MLSFAATLSRLPGQERTRDEEPARARLTD
jgi:hypothetical protein